MICSRSVWHRSRTGHRSSRWSIFIPHCPEKESELLQDQERCFLHNVSVDLVSHIDHVPISEPLTVVGDVRFGSLNQNFPGSTPWNMRATWRWRRYSTSWQDSGSKKVNILLVFAGASGRCGTGQWWVNRGTSQGIKSKHVGSFLM